MAIVRAGLNEREAPGKIVTARPPKPLAQLFTCPGFKFAEAAVKKVKTDTIWQLTLQRQLVVTMYGLSYVVNLFKQKVYHKKKSFCYRDTTQQYFLS